MHNGSSLFTGDAGSGESNIRRYLIENDLLEAIIQLPNNLFYNTGITTYIWLLNNNKPAPRRGKVQLIDANLLFSKLRKNLGNKNCELAADDIKTIVATFLQFGDIEKTSNPQGEPQGIGSQVFDNRDFGYYKVTIERPDRRRAQISQSAINPLRFDRKLIEPMQHLYQQFGAQLYEANFFTSHKTQLQAAIKEHSDSSDTELKTSDKNKLLNAKTWQNGKSLIDAAQFLLETIGTDAYMDFNHFKQQAEKALKQAKIKLSASGKKAIFDAVSHYHPQAAKVIDKTHKLTGAKLGELLNKLDCSEQELPNFGYYPATNQNAKAGDYISYATNADLRDSENIALNKDGRAQKIQDYFLEEVKPHIDEAWINLDSVKIGYEISFNKYFYRHQALRPLAEVAQAILATEQAAEGLIGQILLAENKQ